MTLHAQLHTKNHGGHRVSHSIDGYAIELRSFIKYNFRCPHLVLNKQDKSGSSGSWRTQQRKRTEHNAI